MLTVYGSLLFSATTVFVPRENAVNVLEIQLTSFENSLL